MSRLLLPPLLLLLACDGEPKEEPTDDTGPDTDTGGPDTWPYEEGCVSVRSADGAVRGTAASVTDAVAGAAAGDTVDLAGCSGTMELTDALVIDKDLNLVGPGSDLLTLSAPTNYAGITIAAGSVGIAGLSVASTRDGVEIGAVTVATLADVVVAGSGGWGVSADGAAELILQSVALTGNAYGGLSTVGGGSTRIISSDLIENQSYGAYAADGVTLIIEGSTLSGNVYTGTTDDADGAGVYATGGAVLQMSGNTLDNNELLGVYVIGADLTMDGDAMSGGQYGMAIFDESAVSLADITVTDAVSYGAYIISTSPVSLSGVTISGDPATTADVLDAKWGEDGDFSGTGALVVSDDITVTGATVTGYNNCGLLLAPDTIEGSVSVVSDVTVQGVGRRGIQIESETATFTDVTVTELVEVEDQSLTETGRCTSILYAGVLSFGSNLTWTGGSVSENGGYGIVNAEGALTVDGLTAYSNYCGAILNFYGVLAARNSAFSSPGTTASLTTTSVSGGLLLTASIVDYFGTGSVIENNAFADNLTPYDYISSFKSDGTKYTYAYHYAGSYDIYSTSSESLKITGNTFTGGAEGSVELFETSAEVSGNAWSGSAQALGVYGEKSVLFKDNSVEGFKRQGVYCSSGDLTIEDSTFASSSQLTTSYDYYVNGALQSSNSYDSTYSALYFYNCNASVEGVTLNDLAGQAIVISDYDGGDYEISDLTATNVATEADYLSALDFYTYSSASASTIQLSNVTLTGLGASGNGLELYTYYDTSTLAVEAEDLTIEGAGDNGVLVDGIGASAAIADSSISGSGSHGVSVQDGALTLTGTAITGSGLSGISLDNVAATVTDNAVTGNDEYGMICETATISDCSNNDLTSNAQGEQTGCGAECGVEAHP